VRRTRGERADVARRIDAAQDAVVRVGDDHLAVDAQRQVVRVAEQRRAGRATVARVAFLARPGERADRAVRVDEADPFVVLDDRDRLVVVDLEAAEARERGGSRRAAVAGVVTSVPATRIFRPAWIR
jgi:hypothetical protein